MMIQKSIITVLLVATWLQSCSVVNATVGSDITHSSGGVGLLSDILSGTQSLGAKPVEKRDDPSSSSSSSSSSGQDDDDDNTTSLGAKSGSGVATVSGEQSEGPLDVVDKELSSVLKRRSGHDHDDGVVDYRKLSSQDSEAPHGSTKVSLLNLRRRNGLGVGRVLGDKSLNSKDTGSNHGNLLEGIADLRRRGLLGLGGQASTASSPSPKQSGTSVSLLGRRSDDDDSAGNSRNSDSLIGGLRRRGILGNDGLVGSLLAENGATSSSTESTQPDDTPTPTEQDDDSDADKSNETTTQTKKTNNSDTDNENDIDSDNDNDNDTDNDNRNPSATINATNNDNDNDNDNDTDSDTDSTDNNSSSKNTQALDRRSANLPGASRVARARRHLYARSNDEDRHIMEDYENLVKEQQERQKQIQEENEDLIKKYGNQQYNGQQYNQQYQPFAGQPYQPFSPYPEFDQGKRAAGSRISLFNLRRRMASGGLVDKA